MFNWCWLVRRRQWWPKQHPSSSADAQNIVIDTLYYNKYCYVLVLVYIDYNMLFSYGYGQVQNQWWWTNAPPLRPISKALRMCRSDTDGITRCGMSRATPEATGCRHRVTTCSVLPQQPQGQQANKQQSTNAPKKVAVLMTMATRRYVTLHIARWRRFRALLDATKRHHWASIAANCCNRSCMCRFFTSFFIINSYKKVAGWR